MSLGPSNDEPPEVRVGIRAAQLAGGWDGDGGRISDGEYLGWMARHDDSIALSTDERLAGWLSREIRYAGTIQDIGMWPWDPSRPLDGQFEEWSAKQPKWCAEHRAFDCDVHGVKK